MNLLQKIEKEHMNELASNFPVVNFKSGDTLLVTIKRVKKIKSTKKGKQPELKTYEERVKGVCIAKTSKGIGSNFEIRTIVNNMSVVTMFPLYGTQIEVIDRGVMRQAKPYYLLKLMGRKAKIQSMRDYQASKRTRVA